MCKHSSYTDHKSSSDYKRHSSCEKYSSEKTYSSCEEYSGKKERCPWDGYMEQTCGSTRNEYYDFSCTQNLGPGPVIFDPRTANLIQNGGMELPGLVATMPSSWTITGQGTRTGFSTLAYTGTYATFLNNAATLSQIVQNVKPGKQYELSFYATYGLNQDGGRGLTNGTTIGFNANVYYVQMGTPILLASTQVLPGNLAATYGYYRVITPVLPECATALLVQFIATNGTLVPGAATDVGVLIDDVVLRKA